MALGVAVLVAGVLCLFVFIGTRSMLRWRRRPSRRGRHKVAAAEGEGERHSDGPGPGRSPRPYTTRRWDGWVKFS